MKRPFSLLTVARSWLNARVIQQPGHTLHILIVSKLARYAALIFLSVYQTADKRTWCACMCTYEAEMSLIGTDLFSFWHVMTPWLENVMSPVSFSSCKYLYPTFFLCCWGAAVFATVIYHLSYVARLEVGGKIKETDIVTWVDFTDWRYGHSCWLCVCRIKMQL